MISSQASKQNDINEIQSNRKATEFRVATYNVQSIPSSIKLDAFIKDFQRYKLDVMGIQQTHVRDIFQKNLTKRVFFDSIGKPKTVSGMGFYRILNVT